MTNTTNRGIAAPALLAILAGLLVILVGAYELAKNNSSTGEPTPTATTTPVTGLPASTSTVLTLHFRDEAQIATSDCSATIVVKREIATIPRVADAALKILLTENLPKIKPFYQGVVITNGVATVDFAPAAMEFLNGPACEQGTYKGPIEATLKEFPTVNRVQYSVDGVVRTEWDA